MAFSDKLKAYRIKTDLTQEELGEKIEVSQKTISSWETGRSEPTLGDLTKLCHIFGCTLASLTDTREREVGEITIDDVYKKLKDMSLDELKKLEYEIEDRLRLVTEMEVARREYEKAQKLMREYEQRLKALERK